MSSDKPAEVVSIIDLIAVAEEISVPVFNVFII